MGNQLFFTTVVATAECSCGEGGGISLDGMNPVTIFGHDNVVALVNHALDDGSNE